jgi:hypothetical protein
MILRRRWPKRPAQLEHACVIRTTMRDRAGHSDENRLTFIASVRLMNPAIPPCYGSLLKWRCVRERLERAALTGARIVRPERIVLRRRQPPTELVPSFVRPVPAVRFYRELALNLARS